MVVEGRPFVGVVCWRRGARGRASIRELASAVRLIFGMPPGEHTLSRGDKELGCAVLDRGEPVGLLFMSLDDAEAFRRALGYRWQPPHRLGCALGRERAS